MNTIMGGNVQRAGTIASESTFRTNLASADIRTESVQATTGVNGSREQSPYVDWSNVSEADKKKFEDELNKHNEAFAYTGKLLKFRYDEEAETSFVEVIDTATNEVIVSLPPEFLIELSVKMKKILGMYIDKKL